MLKPAILYKEEITRKFYELFYTDKLYYYIGYPHCITDTPENIGKCLENHYEYAVVIDLMGGGQKVIGYVSYQIDPLTDCAYRFGMISFLKGNNPAMARDIYELIENLLKVHHRIEWRMIGGNPVMKTYDEIARRFHGQKVTFHDAIKDPTGKYQDTYVYEILQSGYSEYLKESKSKKKKKNDYKSALESIAEYYGFGPKIIDAVSGFIIKKYCVKFDLSDPSICDVGNMLSSAKFRDGIRKTVMNVSPDYSIDEDGDEFDVVFSADGVHGRFTVDSAFVSDIILKLWEYYVPEQPKVKGAKGNE